MNNKTRLKLAIALIIVLGALSLIAPNLYHELYNEDTPCIRSVIGADFYINTTRQSEEINFNDWLEFDLLYRECEELINLIYYPILPQGAIVSFQLLIFTPGEILLDVDEQSTIHSITILKNYNNVDLEEFNITGTPNDQTYNTLYIIIGLLDVDVGKINLSTRLSIHI